MDHTAGPRRNKPEIGLSDDAIRDLIQHGPRAFFLSSPLVDKVAAKDPRWGKPMHLQKLHFVCDSIIRQRLGVARISCKRAKYVNLHSKVVERFCTWRDAKAAKLFLIEQGIIESDGEYLPGMKATGYRLTERAWKAGIVAVQIADGRIEKYNGIHRDLRKVGNGKLEADGVRIDNLQFHLNQLHLDEGWIFSHLRKMYAKWIESGRWQDAEAFHSRAFSIYEFMNGHWRFTRCKAGRLHYQLTNMAKEVRGQLRYNGMRLIEADVSCCQPLIAATLYEGDRESQEEKKRYLSSVCSGRFYEDLGALAEYQGTRSELKRDVLKWVFFGGRTSTYRGGIQLDHPVWQAFLDQFPRLARVLMFSKAEIVSSNPFKGDSDMAIRLQRTESTIFIEKVLGQIATEFPGVPAFPVHDCIMTTRENADLVRDLIIASFLEKIGIAPSVSCEAIAPAHGTNPRGKGVVDAVGRGR